MAMLSMEITDRFVDFLKYLFLLREYAKNDEGKL